MIILSKKTVISAGLVLSLLSACGSEVTESQRLAKRAGEVIKGLAKNKDAKPQLPAAAPVIPTKESIGRLGENVYFLAAPQLGIAGFAPRVAINGDWATYRTTDNQTVTVQDGIIVGTRGFVGDLMSHESSLSVEEMFSGTFPKEYIKTQSILDLGSQIRKDLYECTLTGAEDAELNVLGDKVKAIKFEEVCASSFRAYQNRYWLDAKNGRLIQSQQSIHPETGFIVLQEITR